MDEETFWVGVSFEEGVRLKIQAPSDAEAKSKAQKIVEEYASVTESFPAEFKAEAIHRECMVTDAELAVSLRTTGERR